MTEVAQRLYYDSAALDFEARVVDIRLDSKDQTGQLWQLALDRTAFYPTGGGQPHDTGFLRATSKSGMMLDVPVERVEEDENGEVWHYIRKPLNADTEVVGYIDSPRRVDHEQQHSGQHLLSAMFFRELKARTVGFHLGAEVSTIDLDLKERPTEEDLRRVEDLANRTVTEARPFLTHWVEPEYAEEMLRRGDLQKLPPRAGRMRIVHIQGIEFNACGGTHVANTGAIGAITLRRIEKVKQGFRIEFCCGLRAIRAARRDYTLLDTIGRSLSIAPADVPARIEKLLEEKKAQAKEIKKLTAAPLNTPPNA
jgi:alanyl-tRNA synthetase